MRVAIVSKTKMQTDRCVGGIDIDNNRSLRLLRDGGLNQPTNTEFEVGQLWNIEYLQRQNLTPPHIEDVIVGAKQLLMNSINLRQVIHNSEMPIWQADPSNLFGGLIRFTGNGSGYISHRIGLPDQSTGFWISDRDLDFDNDKYYYAPNRRLAFVGVTEPLERIPRNTLIRVSLARWWRPENDPSFEERCYVQLSGWYL